MRQLHVKTDTQRAAAIAVLKMRLDLVERKIGWCDLVEPLGGRGNAKTVDDCVTANQVVAFARWAGLTQEVSALKSAIGALRQGADLAGGVTITITDPERLMASAAMCEALDAKARASDQVVWDAYRRGDNQAILEAAGVAGADDMDAALRSKYIVNAGDWQDLLYSGPLYLCHHVHATMGFA